jgi:hypothetical protein
VVLFACLTSGVVISAGVILVHFVIATWTDSFIIIDLNAALAMGHALVAYHVRAAFHFARRLAFAEFSSAVAKLRQVGKCKTSEEASPHEYGK